MFKQLNILRFHSLRLLKRIIVQNRPKFIFSWQYFKISPPAIIKVHRQLFLLSCKKPIHLLANGIGLIKWLGYFCWLSSYRVTKKTTSEQLAEYYLKHKYQLFWNLIKLGLYNFISPYAYVKNKLYQPKFKQNALAFFYANELPFFHDFSNRKFVDFKKSRILISNKYQFALALQKINIPTVSSESFLVSEVISNLSILFQRKSIFCKPNSGSRSIGVFFLDYDMSHNTYQLIPVKEHKIIEQKEIKNYLQTQYKPSQLLLVQPFIKDHTEVKKLSKHSASTTLRVITAKMAPNSQSVPNLIYLQLEIPLTKQLQSQNKMNQSSKNNGLQFYQILPLDVNSFAIDEYFIKNQLDNKNLPNIPNVLKLEIRKAVDYCVQSHHKLLRLNSVSFDLILSSTEPIIIEANYNWNIEMLYQVTKPGENINHPAAKWLNAICST